ncbi:unnamed protein product [Chironomus riparius]|uniref:Mitochondrial import inner membrane translocase subunit Tim29 n=1 Tax=Chironomus riparius TaxID=315576 RepID=A0A9N9RTA7_9DIPT|nr:unnamed protein product [Chironomus riparius]
MSLKILKLPQLPEKLKGTIVERWINYWKGLGRDYKEVGKDTLKFMKANPVKSSIYGSIGLSSYISYKTNPTFEQYTDQLRTAQNLIGMVFPESQNPKTLGYLRYMEHCRNEERIRISSFALFSFIWVHDNSNHLSTADAKCDYLKPTYSSMYDRIVDFGFYGTYWNLKKQMENYDVNL